MQAALKLSGRTKNNYTHLFITSVSNQTLQTTKNNSQVSSLKKNLTYPLKELLLNHRLSISLSYRFYCGFDMIGLLDETKKHPLP